jgi:hypothetical protein
MSGVRGGASGEGRTDVGLGRILVLVYGVFALAATGRSGVQLATKAGEAPLAYGLSAFAAVVYCVATYCLAKPGPTTTRLAWVAVTVELVGVLVVGTLTVADPALFPDDTVWSRYGSGYGYVPAVLPFLGLAWLRTATRHRDQRVSGTLTRP